MGATMGKSGGNLLDSLPTQGTLHVVMLGLDSAGKTTALYRLKFDQYLNTVPTIGFNCEKIQGTVGKAKGVHFLVWDVGGQEKLRPLWRSYTRCTDGILFVVDSVDVERMEEAKMELMRTAKCPDNQGVPVLILANKQDLPGARDPKELEKFLGLHELSPLYPSLNLTSLSSSSSSNATNNSATTPNSGQMPCITPTSQHYHNHQQHHKSISQQISTSTSSALSSASTTANITTKAANCDISYHHHNQTSITINQQQQQTPTIKTSGIGSQQHHQQHFKGWYIQPACAITGEGLQEGLEALYDMIVKKRKMTKANKKKR
ncbi:ADP-ribosylation factor-like protein 4A [Eupeodes corollae]|uniref:ADP-ribosylation factor-like protein 4A n=1 Tax=Eupeodes corollae TaxID=290404 RepID=UPI0024922029|nr:ADP-ribosylation factor-like protein 4A [Eupeodes corollae]XP_055922273.1 ADP-ribosylation factor-like protein 4A [Eupeodes corollae]XP_055922274.1 ADP-ribosylation factor-like protein 4A [Eupeodes corollae]XP_055922275.1 ADP-ribosylation factor-like protein 4A [Eupeodes corollae]XP_055922276.1 ADP-ribosylation factor-like protein 4A [Eupeodes corollae]